MQQLNILRPVMFAICGALVAAGQAAAVPLSVDGNVADWGFTLNDNNGSTFVPAPGLNLLGLVTEDQNDHNGDSGFLGPYTGGQNFDAEMMAAAIQNGKLYVIIVSGQRPDNGFSRYAPGDIRIDTSGGMYVVEVGGGVGGGAGTPITEGAPGYTYVMDQGFTTGIGSTPASQTAGSMWFEPWFLFFQQMQNPGSTFVANTDYIFTRNAVTAQHSIIEFSVPLTAFGNNVLQNIGWGPACDNDYLSITIPPVPEPSTMVLALCGVVGAVFAARRRAA